MKVAGLQHDIVWEDRDANFARLAPMIAARRGRRCAARRAHRDVLDRLLDGRRPRRRAAGRAERDVPRRRRRASTTCGCAGRFPNVRRRTSGRSISSCSPRPTARCIATPRSIRSATAPSPSTTRPATRSSRSTSRASAARSSFATTCASPTSSGRSRRPPIATWWSRTGPGSGARTGRRCCGRGRSRTRRSSSGVNRVGTGDGLTYVGDSVILDPLGEPVAAAGEDGVRDHRRGRRRRACRRCGRSTRSSPIGAEARDRFICDRRARRENVFYLSAAVQRILHEVRPVLRDSRRPSVESRQRARRLQEHARAGDRRRAGRLPRVLDRRAPLPRGVLALLESRGALRRDRGAHDEDAPRLRRAAHAQAVQPPGAHRGVGRGARPALRRPRRHGHRSFGDAHRARRLRRRPEGHARDVARGDRARGRLLDQRAHVVPGQALVVARPARAAQAVAATAPADLGRDHERRRSPAGRRARSRAVLVRGRRVARRREEEDRHLPRVGRRSARRRSASS